MACEVCHEIYKPKEVNEADSDVKPHLCVTCGQSFSLKIQLKRHVMLHADGAPYTCIKCMKDNDKKGKTYNLRLGNSNDYTCDICLKSFSNKRLLLRHSIQHTFDRISDTEECYEEAVKNDVTPPKPKSSPKKNVDKSEPLSCKVCNKNFQSWLALEKHTLTHSATKSKSLFCQNCNKAFAYQACFDKHIKKGNCNTTAPSIPILKIKQVKSESSEAENKKHSCSVCNKTFTRKSTLDGHELGHILNKEDSEVEKEISGYDSDEYIQQPKKPRTSTFKLQKSYTCDKCNFVCFSKKTLNKHMNNQHNVETSSIDTEDKRLDDENDYSDKIKDKSYEANKTKKEYECESCSKKFKSEEKLRKHSLVHLTESNEGSETHVANGTFLCHICDKRFLTKRSLKQHLLFHVEKNSNDSLSEKSVTFGKQRQARSKNLACEICGRRFAGELCLKKHILKHEKEKEREGVEAKQTVVKVRVKKPKVIKELICEYCKEDFTGKRAAYMKHIHAHTPEVCGICDERFVDRQSLREHCKIHVGTEEGRMFMQCSQKALEAKNGVTQPEPRVEYIYLVLR